MQKRQAAELEQWQLVETLHLGGKVDDLTHKSSLHSKSISVAAIEENF